MKPISKSKRQLAQLLIEAGVKCFPEGANWAAQDKGDTSDHLVCFYTDKPHHNKGSEIWNNDVSTNCVSDVVSLETLIPNWHQTVLTRAEFDQVVAESAERSKPDADGWIEWEGGECPVWRGTLVDVKYANGAINIGVSALTYITHSDHTCGTQPGLLATDWDCKSSTHDIVAYRLHKPEHNEPQYCESVARTIPNPVTVPTLDQLLQDYRNAADFATRKHAEADEAAKMRDERWQAVQARAGEMGVTVGLCESAVAELAITDLRDLRVGDEVECIDTPCGAECKPGMVGVVTCVRDDGIVARFEKASRGGRSEWFSRNGRAYRFIRRP